MDLRIYDPSEIPFSEFSGVAIAITISGENQRHVGIFHKSDTGEAFLLHLAWHFRLVNVPAPFKYGWVDLLINPKRAKQVAARCREIFRANHPQGIPYAFSEPDGCFDSETFQFLVGPSRLGLTCSTFVLAVFQSAGIQLVRSTTWPEREEDETWRTEILAKLENGGPTVADHVRAVREGHPGVRIRPEEVAGAGAGDVLPCEFGEAQKNATEILQFLLDHDLAIAR